MADLLCNSTSCRKELLAEKMVLIKDHDHHRQQTVLMKLKAVISGRIQNHPDTWLALSWNDIMETRLDSQAIGVPPGPWIYLLRYSVRQRCVINSNGMQICGGWDKYLRSIKYFHSLENYFHIKMAIYWNNQKGISMLTILAHKLTIWLHALIPSQEGL